MYLVGLAVKQCPEGVFPNISTILSLGGRVAMKN